MKIHTFFQSHVTHYNTISHGVYPIRVKLRNNNQSLIRVESVMSPAGGGTGGGLDSPIASTTFSILCITPLIFFNTSFHRQASAFVIFLRRLFANGCNHLL